MILSGYGSRDGGWRPAERERDPLFRSMFKTVLKRYSRLAQQADDERNAKLAYKSSPPNAAGDTKRR